MKEVVELIAKSLVDYPEEVLISEIEQGDSLVLELSVAANDMGKVIGKSGKIAKAMRSIVKAASSRSEKRVTLEIK